MGFSVLRRRDDDGRATPLHVTHYYRGVIGGTRRWDALFYFFPIPTTATTATTAMALSLFQWSNDLLSYPSAAPTAAHGYYRVRRPPRRHTSIFHERANVTIFPYFSAGATRRASRSSAPEDRRTRTYNIIMSMRTERYIL